MVLWILYAEAIWDWNTIEENSRSENLHMSGRRPDHEVQFWTLRCFFGTQRSGSRVGYELCTFCELVAQLADLIEQKEHTQTGELWEERGFPA